MTKQAGDAKRHRERSVAIQVLAKAKPESLRRYAPRDDAPAVSPSALLAMTVLF